LFSSKAGLMAASPYTRCRRINIVYFLRSISRRSEGARTVGMTRLASGSKDARRQQRSSDDEVVLSNTINTSPTHISRNYILLVDL